MSVPAVCVVVGSHGRALHLRWLLNALKEQAGAEPFEAVVVHDYDEAERTRLLEDHPLVRAGIVRLVGIKLGTGSPARQRNVGWRATDAPLVAFTDDDCRPDAGWLAELLAAARAHPGAIVQGATRPDPFEHDVLAAPHIRTLSVTPPTSRAQTCNILYPRAVLDVLGGFDERAIVGEDVDLALRARGRRRAGRGSGRGGPPRRRGVHAPGHRAAELEMAPPPLAAGAPSPAAPRVPPGRLLGAGHGRLALAAAGAAATRAHPALALFALPYAAEALSRRGPGARARAVALAELPGQLSAGVAELATYAIGSARHRTLVL